MNETNPLEEQPQSTPTPSTTDPGQASPPVQVSPEQPETAESRDDEDVPAALQRETQDGKGDDEVPPENWQSYATEGVEKEDNA